MKEERDEGNEKRGKGEMREGKEGWRQEEGREEETEG